MIVAAMISTALGTRLAAVGENSFVGARTENIVLPRGHRALLVDDSIRSGRALQNALQLADLPPNCLETCVVYAQSQSIHLVDYYADILDGPRVFQWNFSGTKASRDFCWDLDGVICTNPTVFDDDSDSYRREIRSGVKPLHLPQVPAKAIITNRIERWRRETEQWLEQYGVKYATLVMQPYRTARERRAESTPAAFKAAQLKSLGGTLFIESDDKQAVQIASLSGIPVICIERMCLYDAAPGEPALPIIP